MLAVSLAIWMCLLLFILEFPMIPLVYLFILPLTKHFVIPYQNTKELGLQLHTKYEQRTFSIVQSYQNSKRISWVLLV